MIVDILIGAALIAGMVVLIWWWDKNLTEAQRWDWAAHHMWMHGYTDLEIEDELGPRPKDPEDDPML